MEPDQEIENVKREGRNLFLRYEAENHPHAFQAVPNARAKLQSEQQKIAFDEAYEAARLEHYQKIRAQLARIEG